MRTPTWIKAGIAAVLFSTGAVAGDSGTGGLISSLVGSTPSTTVGGVVSGGVPWTISQARANVLSGGHLNLEVRGLLIKAGPGVPPNLVGTTGPVQMVAVSLVCGGSGGTVAASTDGVPLSAAGNATIQTKLTLISECIGPVVLVRFFNAAAPPGSQLGPFIALTGFN
jgi:hypothetical protein